MPSGTSTASPTLSTGVRAVDQLERVAASELGGPDDDPEPDHLQDCGGILAKGQACCREHDDAQIDAER